MGRKIPGKKHHGVKDPAIQKLRRDLALKDKVNAPPTKVDYQEIPKRVLEIGRLKELAKKSQTSFKPRKIRKKSGGKRGRQLDLGLLGAAGPKLPGMKHTDKNLPRLKMMPGESEGMFLERVEAATSELISEVKMEAQHNVLINRNKSGDVIKVEKGLTDETKRRIRKSVQNFHMGKTKNSEMTSKKEKKEIKNIQSVKSTERGGSKKSRPGKKKRQKMKQSHKNAEKELEGLEKRYEQVKFGEVVQEPPHIKKRPRGVDTNSKPSVEGLLLTDMLNPRKDVSMATKKRLEQQRLDVVQAYRALKAARSQTLRKSS